ncbi:methyltransferase [Colletotrichum higginsianum]|uniref:Methyltransferase n=1 Tax=Colletotrichum higginsianum (strain IMI 349063) TaxID=759273 RepID=H1VEI0_COLHI|nr:methyltransferase [Colletotrichum higginsianum]
MPPDSYRTTRFATPESLKEIHRVLKPTAVLGLIWNIEDYNKPQHWEASTPLGSDGQPRFRDFVWKDDVVLEGGRKMPLFSVPVGEEKVPFTTWLTPEAIWNRLRTLSQVAVLQGEAAGAFKARFDAILGGESVERNERGEVALHGVTYFAWTSRL